MLCHLCGKTVEREDRFCTGCGASLQSVDDTTERVEAVAPDPTTIADEPTELMPTMGRPVPPPPPAAATAMPPPAGPPTVPPAATTPDRRLDPPAEPAEPATMQIDEWSVDVPVWAATGTVPTQPAVAPPASDTDLDDVTPTGGFTADLPATQPITEVWMDAVTEAPATPATGPTAGEPAVDATVQMTSAGTAEMTAVAAPAPPTQGFRISAISVIALLTGLVTLVSLFADMVVVTSDRRLLPSGETPFGFRTGSWIADDLADNLSIAGLLAILLMIVGGIASGFRWRWGAGLAGGAGLAVAGLAGLAIGLAQIPIDAAHEFVRIPNEQQFTLTITRDLGYWLLIAAAALGVVLFFASINDASDDHRDGLNPWIAALGGLAAVVAAAGPLLPEKRAVFSDNWYLIEGPGEAPSMLLAGRLIQLALLLLAGVVGFLMVRRWGLGLVIGGATPVIWLTVSTLFELTDRPVGPGFRNPGATDMHVHGVTTIGVSALAAMSVLAVIAAYDQGVRQRR